VISCCVAGPMESNPYQSPNSASDPSLDRRASGWHLVFFLVNFVAAVLWVLICVVCVVEVSIGGGSPFAFAGAVCSFGPAFAFAIAEWLLFVRNFQSLRRPLGIICGLVGALAVFALASDMFRAVVEGGAPGALFWMIFGSISVAVATYGFWCCWYRLRHRPSFANGPAVRESIEGVHN
jgi:hypothetical protein